MEHKQFNLTEYYNLVIDFFEKNKVSSEEGKVQIDRLILKCLDNEYQTKFKEPIFLTEESAEQLKTCFFEEFKPLFTQHYRPVFTAGGGKKMKEGTFSLLFNENETNMFENPNLRTMRMIDKGINEILRPQALRMNEAKRKEFKEQGKEGSEGCSPYIEFILDEKETQTEIYRKHCTGFSLTKDIISQLVGEGIGGEFRITSCRVEQEAVTIITLTPVELLDTVKQPLEEQIKEVAKKLELDKYENKDLMNVRFTGQTEDTFNGYLIYQIPRKFGEEKRVPYSMAISEFEIPGYLVDTLELRNEKEMGYGNTDTDFVFVHLRRKIEGGETR